MVNGPPPIVGHLPEETTIDPGSVPWESTACTFSVVPLRVVMTRAILPIAFVSGLAPGLSHAG